MGCRACTVHNNTVSFFGLYRVGVTDCNVLGCTIDDLRPTHNFIFSKGTPLRLINLF